MAQNKEDNQKVWTIIVIGTKWGTLSFQVPHKAIYYSVALLAVCLCLAGYGVFQIAGGTAKAPAKTAVSGAETRTELETARKEIVGLKEKLRAYDNQFISIGQKTPLGKKENEVLASSAKPYDVAIDQFRMRYHAEDGSYHFHFLLHTSGLKRVKASGYIFIILRSSRTGYESGQAYPFSELKDSRPHNFKDGEHFAISRQKTVQGAIKKIPGPNIYETADVLIYSDEGALLWEKNYNLKVSTGG
jgi:hypothetical protein